MAEEAGSVETKGLALLRYVASDVVAAIRRE